MAKIDSDVFRRQARLLKALANESRLKIVDRLAKGGCSAGELTEIVGSDRTTVSKHLAVLRAHDIVRDRREGNVVHYTLLTPCVVNFFSCAAQVLKERAEGRALDHQRSREAASVAGEGAASTSGGAVWRRF